MQSNKQLQYSRHGALSTVLLNAFLNGRGDFTVKVVPSGDNAEGEIRRFPVLSAVLCEWSEVFAAMLQHDMVEKSSRELQIVGYSVSAVASFLRFLHSASLEADAGVVVEVAALADKYNVSILQELCSEQMRCFMSPANACEFLAQSSQVGSQSAHEQAKEVICQHAGEALVNAFMLTPALLEEVLSSPLLCISDSQLAQIFLEWADKPMAKNNGHDVVVLMRSHVQLSALTRDELSKMEVLATKLGHGEDIGNLLRISNRGSFTEDVFATLWQQFKSEFAQTQTAFLGFWLNLIPSRASIPPRIPNGHPTALHSWSDVAIGISAATLSKDDELVWFMPHHSVLLTGISFPSGVVGDAHVQVSAS
eukprot:TRINITY_DN91241_c0_g1_i1.p1 TRINITY_DN91241_c0_g1~~TRINITY_DN91241_c0_g1_i1.p1  ORF type:complete len:365 (-),score=75.32 TRINITY_DN91241_c0_g1_i1:255-1349(-)